LNWHNDRAVGVPRACGPRNGRPEVSTCALRVSREAVRRGLFLSSRVGARRSNSLTNLRKSLRGAPIPFACHVGGRGFESRPPRQSDPPLRSRRPCRRAVGSARGVDALRDLAREIGARGEETRTAPEFRRFVLSRGDESVVVDLVVERAPQLVAHKPSVGVIRLDPPEEILANKLCALLGRAEIRDLVDVRALEQSGLSP